MTTLDDLLREIGALHMEVVMLRRLVEAQNNAPAEEQEEKNESSSEVASPAS